MQTQNYQNHRKLRPETTSHKIYFVIVPAFMLFTVANLIRAIYLQNGRINAILFVMVGLSLFYAYLLFRSFALKAQDRAIRAEENLRHFVLTGKVLYKSLTVSQIIALRFAPNEEFVALAERAAKENLSNNDIKKAIINWKADIYRA